MTDAEHPGDTEQRPASPSDALADAIAAEYRAWIPVERQPAPPTPPVSSGEAVPPSAAPTPSANPLAGLSSPQAAPPGPAIPPPPVRASLPDDALLEVLDPEHAGGDTAALIDLFQEQLALREREARQLDEWEEEVRRSGGPDAERIVTEVRSAYTGVIDVIPPSDDDPAVLPESAPLSRPEGASMASPDSAPTAPGRVVSAAIDPATLTGAALDDVLADAPPPDSALRTVATPPDEHAALVADDTGPVPPPLVEPQAPSPRGDVVSSASDWEALLSAPPPSAAEVVESAPPPGSVGTPPAADSPATDEAETVSSGTPEGVVEEAQAARAPSSMPTPVVAPAAAPSTVETSPGHTDDSLSRPARGPRAFALEQSALEPTPEALRAGRGVRQFWLWFAVNASVVVVALGALIVADGASLRQAVLAALTGVALSGFLLGVVTRTGRWSSQPTIVVGRATFGRVGNVVPAVVAIVVRAVWAAALIFVLALGVSEVLVTAELAAGLGRATLTALCAGVACVIAAVVATLGFGLIARLGAVVAVASAVLTVGVVALTAEYVDLPVALSRPDGPWALLISGAVLVTSAVGLAWVSSGGDLVRYQARGASGASAAVWTALGVAVPAFVLVSWGALLAASSPTIAAGLVENPVDTIARLLPLWYPIPLVLAIALSLFAGAALSLYSGGFAVLAAGVPAPRWAGVVVAALLGSGVLSALLLGGAGIDGLLRDALVLLAVPVAAWAGLVGVETLLRRRRVSAVSLLQANGVYPSVRWGMLGGYLAATAAGFALVSGDTALLGWAGFGWPLLGEIGTTAWASSDLGVLLALGLGAVVAAVTVPALRRIEAAEDRAAA